MMDIDGLINNRDQQQALHLAANPFALPSSTSSVGAANSAAERAADEMTAFAFPSISP